MQYIGVSGINERVSIGFLRDAVALMPEGCRFAAGILVNRKIIDGEAPKRRRNCAREHILSVVRSCRAVGAWPVIHYNVKDGEFSSSLEVAKDTVLDVLQNIGCAVQINGFSGSLDALKEIKRALVPNELILQFWSSTLGQDSHRDEWVRAIVDHYSFIDHALIDLSGGTGLPADVGFFLAVLRALPDRVQRSGVKFGIAGGFDAETVLGLAGECVSVDAESRLRSSDDELIEGKALAYVRAASEVLRVVDDREHPMMQFFNHNPYESPAPDVERMFFLCAQEMAKTMKRGPRLDAALEQLLLALGYAKRAAVLSK